MGSAHSNPSISFITIFPKISPFSFYLGGDEIQKVVVMNYSPEQTSVNAVNFKNRKKVTFKEHTLEPIIFFHNCIDGDRLPLLLDVMQKMFQANKGTFFTHA